MFESSDAVERKCPRRCMVSFHEDEMDINRSLPYSLTEMHTSQFFDCLCRVRSYFFVWLCIDRTLNGSTSHIPS